MENLIFNLFLKNNYSTHQIRSRLLVLKNYLAVKLFNAQPGQLTESDLQWINSLSQDFFNSFTALNTSQILSELDQKLQQIQPLVIYLPFDLPDNEVDRLGVWLRSNISPNLVFDLKFEGNLIGGAALSWKGIYKDYSMRSKIEANKDAITQSIKKFLK